MEREGDEKDGYRLMRPAYLDRSVFEFEEMSSPVGLYRVPVDRPVRIYCDGVYDLFHYGHARSLRQAKCLFPNVYLLVGVTDDDITIELKGNLVMNERERAESLRHCRYVDEVVTSAPWELTTEFLSKHKVDFVAHDDVPYKTGDKEDVYKMVKDMGMFIPIKRTKGISTSGIITGIVRNYDMYVRRNLERGVSAKDLNVSFLQMKRIKVSKKMNEIMRNVDIQKELEDIRREIRVAMRHWERVSNEIIGGFIDNFHRGRASNGIIDRIVGLVTSRKGE